MYRLEKNNNYAVLKNKILGVYQPHTFVDAIGHHHKLHEIKLIDNSAIELTYVNAITNHSYGIPIKFAYLHFNLDIEKNNRCYSEYLSHMRHELKDYSLKDVPMNIDQRMQLIGISVGDFLKHFYYANQKNNKFDVDFGFDESENEKNNLLFTKFIKKALLVDTNITNVANVLGLYLFRNKSIYLWDHLKIDGVIGREHNKFEDFCKKILYFSSVGHLIGQTQDKDKTLYIREEACLNMFNAFSDQTIVKKILGYYFYNENPEFVSVTQSHYFDPPKTIPDVLLYIKEKYNDNHCLDLHNKIMKKLNTHEKKDLAEKYPVITFNSCNNIPKEYPFYALRNVYIKNWNGIHYWLGDTHFLEKIYNEQRMAIINNKYKYKNTISEKKIPLDYAYCRCVNYDKYRPGKKDTGKYFKEMIRETYDTIDNY